MRLEFTQSCYGAEFEGRRKLLDFQLRPQEWPSSIVNPLLPLIHVLRYCTVFTLFFESLLPTDITMIHKSCLSLYSPNEDLSSQNVLCMFLWAVAGLNHLISLTLFVAIRSWSVLLCFLNFRNHITNCSLASQKMKASAHTTYTVPATALSILLTLAQYISLLCKLVL